MSLANPTPVKILPVGSAISDWGYTQQGIDVANVDFAVTSLSNNDDI
jgi:hypothetical protein